MEAGGPFAQCDASNTYVTHPDAISCDDPSLQSSLANLIPTTAPAPQSTTPISSTSPTTVPSAMANMDMSSSMSTEAQAGLLVASVLFFVVVYGVLFRKRPVEGTDEGERMGRKRPLPLVRHAVDEQQHINNDELDTASSSSSSTSTTSTASEPGTQMLPLAPASVFSLGWLLGRQVDKVQFSALEQQDSDEQEAGEAGGTEQVERGVRDVLSATAVEVETDSGVEVAVTYR